MAAITPMMRQYLDIRERNSDCLLFFRLGDFYELFGDDARVASKELDLTLTSRDRTTEDPNDRVPMCGVPYHSSEAYIARLIARGYKVAICEQMEDPALAKGLVERDIIRVVTPGTVMESSMLDEGRPNYLTAIYVGKDGAAICFADLSTGEISVSSFDAADHSRMKNELGTYSPSEAIINSGASELPELTAFLQDKLACLVECDDARFDLMRATSLIDKQFDVKNPDEVGIVSKPAATMAVGALLSYLVDTQKTDISHFNELRVDVGGVHMELDIQTMRNLELIYSINASEKRGSLLWVLDRTKTPMGKRLIRSWILRPLISAPLIIRRQNAVEELYRSTIERGELLRKLRGVGDIERLIGKIVYGSAGGRDMKALSSSIAALPDILELLSKMRSGMISEIKKLDTLRDIFELIENTLGDELPFSVREGGLIRDGADREVDYLRGLLKNSTGALSDIEARERERTGKKLKIGYNRVFGYYIEIPRSSSEDVPPDYIRKQTLSNCERFITPELKELETALLTAKDKLAALEFDLFTKLREKVAADVRRVQRTSLSIAELDVLCALAETAVKNNYTKPQIDMSGVIEIRAGRHPVVEQMQPDTLFVPNDTNLNTNDTRSAIITGPNMAGKSTYMRQTALIVIMAQIGSFVPASSARLGVVDRVFTRIGASDDISAGMSTFMVEMTEVAEMLKSATANSLLILDEIGRGTSTYDGMSIARAVLEYVSDSKKLGAKTLFSTHFHELTGLENEIPGIKNYNISAKKRGDDIIFLRKIVPGGADDSYGIEVASLAGVPEPVIKRAKAVLQQLEQSPPAGRTAPAPAAPGDQMSLGDVAGGAVAAALRAVDLNTLTPLEAMNLLFKLKNLCS